MPGKPRATSWRYSAQKWLSAPEGLKWCDVSCQIAGLVASGRGQDPLLFDLGSETYSTISMTNEGAPFAAFLQRMYRQCCNNGQPCLPAEQQYVEMHARSTRVLPGMIETKGGMTAMTNF